MRTSPLCLQPPFSSHPQTLFHTTNDLMYMYGIPKLWLPSCPKTVAPWPALGVHRNPGKRAHMAWKGPGPFGQTYSKLVLEEEHGVRVGTPPPGPCRLFAWRRPSALEVFFELRAL